MGITLVTAARNAACDAIVDLVDAGGGAGYINVYHSDGTTVLATFTCSATAFGAASTGTATLAGVTLSTTAAATGTATTFRFYDFADTEIFRGTVGTSGADINFNSVSWTSGDTVELTAFTLTVPAS